MTMELEQSLKEKKLNNNHIKLSSFRVIFAILITDAAGIVLRYYKIDTYFIFLGFRFHLSAFLPFLILYNKNILLLLLGALSKPYFKKKFLPFLWLFIALIILLGTLYLLKKVTVGDPEYFYEFGLSSIFDYPLYLVWNFPQFCLLFTTLMIISSLNKYHYLTAFAGFILLFFWEFIPVDLKINPFEFIPFITAALIASFFLTRLQNIYWFSIIVFSSVWSIVLLFGSKSATVINMFFAKEYNSWDGFLVCGKDIAGYVVSAYFIILLFIVLFYVIFKRDKGDIKDNLFR
ncbi:MAG TPA: hypothetical protein VLB50_12045 [Ignavibacteriaceae bacterium]|nr:hypothetical protein [Ignavibacteriaceae bacterium]